MKKRNTVYFFYLIGLVIVGLVGVQLYWIRHSIAAQKASLDRNLKEDVQGVVKEVEESAHCFTLYSKAYIKRGEGVYMVKQNWKDGKFRSKAEGGYLDTMKMFNVFPTRNKDSMFYAENSLNFETYPATVDVTMKFSFLGVDENFKHLGDSVSYQVADISADNFRDLLTDKFKVDEVIDMQMLDSLIKNSLKKNKLDTFYEAGIRKQGARSFEYMSQGSVPAHLQQANIKADFLSNRFNKPYELLLYVPDTYVHVVRSLMAMMVSSLIIILVLVISYIYFIRTILSQRRLSDMKNTFINNITHEFRTPITNINLAVENWKDSKSNGNGSKNLYVDVIAEENKHMERNVEQILQLAVLEGDTERKYFHRTNINALIEEAIKSFSIQLQNIGGVIKTDFNAEHPYLFCNGQQMRNMLQNLLDNAIKYRGPQPLVIIISTFDTGSHFVVQVEDNGIGMSVETQKHIFDRFFRGNTGDRHDVKGFGLGMSYVKYIVDAHEGEINIKSKQGKGTRMTVYLPKTLETVS